MHCYAIHNFIYIYIFFVAIITLPPTWTKMEGKDLDIILLLENSDEFQKISKQFVQSCQVSPQSNGKKIEVVQVHLVTHANSVQLSAYILFIQLDIYLSNSG